MKPIPSVHGVAKELRLSQWIFAFFAISAAAIVALEFLVTRRIEGGWAVASAVAIIGWIGVRYFAEQLERLQNVERSNP